FFILPRSDRSNACTVFRKARRLARWGELAECSAELSGSLGILRGSEAPIVAWRICNDPGNDHGPGQDTARTGILRRSCTRRRGISRWSGRLQDRHDKLLSVELAVIVVSYNTRELLRRCLRSLLARLSGAPSLS